VIDYGLINREEDGESKMYAYLIMPRYSHNLDTWFDKMKFKFSNESILDLAQRLLSVFKEIHSAGYAYNDLKLDNIMVGYGQKLLKVKENEHRSSFEEMSLHLVDFGYSSKFMRKDKHISEDSVKSFKGNMMFSSLNQLQFKTPSRRDDMISLCYLISYLLNSGELKDMDFNNEMD
jgi:serine/threonine protein kinase